MALGQPTSLDAYVGDVGVSGPSTISVTIGNDSWPKDHPEYVLSASVSATVGHEASTCRVVARCNESDVSLLSKAKVGSPIEVAIGRSGNNKTVFKGFISGVDFNRDFVNAKNDNLIVINAMDAKIWMMVSKKTIVKKPNTTFSQAAAETIDLYKSSMSGSSIKVKGEKKAEYICQKDESDYDFLCRLADLAGALFFVSLGKLYFVSPGEGRTPNTTFSISPERGIKNAKISANIYGLPSEITVIGINEQDPSNPDKANLVVSVTKPNTLIGKGAAASDFLPSNVTSKGKSDITTITIVDSTLNDKGQAENIAEAEFMMRTLRLATLKLTLHGINCLEVGTKVTVSGFDKPIDNEYILTGIEHDCVAGGEFTSTLTLNANKYNLPAASLI